MGDVVQWMITNKDRGKHTPSEGKASEVWQRMKPVVRPLNPNLNRTLFFLNDSSLDLDAARATAQRGNADSFFYAFVFLASAWIAKYHMVGEGGFLRSDEAFRCLPELVATKA